jgi:hypothetical protein
MKFVILLVCALCVYTSYADEPAAARIPKNMTIADENITSVLGNKSAVKSELGNSSKTNEPISPLSTRFCTSAEVDKKKKDLCYAAQFLTIEHKKYQTKLKELEQPQKIYTDLRQEIVATLQRAHQQTEIAASSIINDLSPINIGRSFQAVKEGIKRSIGNITQAAKIREAMVAMNGPRDMWAQNVKDARDEHEKYFKYLELFKYHNKVELESAKKKVAHLENITVAKTAELKMQLDHAERMALKNKEFVSNPNVDDDAGALALQSQRTSTSNAAATKRYLLAIEAELKLAKLQLTKIQMRTPGAALPSFPDIKPAKNYAEDPINAIKNAQLRLDEAASKQFNQLAGANEEFSVIAKMPGAPKPLPSAPTV